jgi:hypothetical protein
MGIRASKTITAIGAAAWLSGAQPVHAQDASDERFGRVSKCSVIQTIPDR